MRLARPRLVLRLGVLVLLGFSQTLFAKDPASVLVHIELIDEEGNSLALKQANLVRAGTTGKPSFRLEGPELPYPAVSIADPQWVSVLQSVLKLESSPKRIRLNPSNSQSENYVKTLPVQGKGPSNIKLQLDARRPELVRVLAVVEPETALWMAQQSVSVPKPATTQTRRRPKAQDEETTHLWLRSPAWFDARMLVPGLHLPENPDRPLLKWVEAIREGTEDLDPFGGPPPLSTVLRGAGETPGTGPLRRDLDVFEHPLWRSVPHTIDGVSSHEGKAFPKYMRVLCRMAHIVRDSKDPGEVEAAQAILRLLMGGPDVVARYAQVEPSALTRLDYFTSVQKRLAQAPLPVAERQILWAILNDGAAESPPTCGTILSSIKTRTQQ